ncbi:MAG: hypothetical protein KHW90_02675, partial [Clostridiales bacterium]|nr:hypothetical protein [Clostridiales bacterium]
ISRSKYLSIFGYGALPHRPTKGLSGRPLETFGRKYLIFPEIFGSVSLTAHFIYACVRRISQSSTG